MKTAKHIIIDIETLGRRNDAAITQIGIVPADENFDVLDRYLIQTEPKTWNTCERTFTGETLLWWIQQKNIPGDLVMVKKSALQFAKDKIFKVISSLSGGFVKVVMLNDSSTTYSISNNAIRPIPITPEILEKNGWMDALSPILLVCRKRMFEVAFVRI